MTPPPFALPEWALAYRLWVLEGPLGAGKTTLVQQLCRHLGVEADVTSPTFSLINEYPLPGGGGIVAHADLYRLRRGLDEALELGLDDLMARAQAPAGTDWCLIEWASMAPGLVDGPHIVAHLDYAPAPLDPDTPQGRTLHLTRHHADPAADTP